MTSFFQSVETFSLDLTRSFSIKAAFNPEDQLKPVVAALVEDAGKLIGINIKTITEVQEGIIGRPDLGVSQKNLLIGHIELKAPGKGAIPELFKGRDKEQWERFKDLPNLIYTDGNEWSLYRSGGKVGKTIRFIGDVTLDGKKAVDSVSADSLLNLLRDFINWEPLSPSSPKALAKLLAPICRLLRSDVMDALEDENSNISSLVNDWRKYLFPDSDNQTFADAYAQTITYTLLLARLSGEQAITVPGAVQQIKTHHPFLADVLKILGDEQAQQGIEIPIQLLERLISAVDLGMLYKRGEGDPWLYFYEDFLAEYDPKLRSDRGVYYTPIEVVQAQVRLVAELLEKKFNAKYSFADDKVITLDPATGTGTYLLTALKYSLDKIEIERGAGMRTSAATQAANNMHGFEIMVGPYTVANLRMTQALTSDNAKLPNDSVHIYLTDTLESPNAPPLEPPFMYKGWEREHNRAQKIKRDTPVLVCIGNPPYDRQQVDPDEGYVKRKGGWVRYGDKTRRALLDDFLEPLSALGLSVHAKNLYNDYVYFWRWALWKVIENNNKGIVSFITAASYLRGPGFAAMRQRMREAFDEIWIIDLEGDNLGTRKTENVFQIQSPVAIALCVRYQEIKIIPMAKVHYSRIEGSREEKLSQLSSIHSFTDIDRLNKPSWRSCLSGKTDPFLPVNQTEYWTYPLLTDLYPWQENGVMLGRTWPCAVQKQSLMTRWKLLLEGNNRKGLFKDSPSGRKWDHTAPELPPKVGTLQPISRIAASTSPPEIIKFSFRSFDRHYLFADGRLIDRPSPNLWKNHSKKQLYLTSLLTGILGEGPSAIISDSLPDKHHFRGSFGGKDVIPLWQKSDGFEPNITKGILDILSKDYHAVIHAEDFFSYTYGIMFATDFVKQFWEELTIPGIRLPVTKDYELFQQTVLFGRELIYLHTFGERFVPPGKKAGQIPQGVARCKVGTPANREDYPENFSYFEESCKLHVGKGIFTNIRPEVWNFSVSGLQVVKSWLGYRMKDRSGKKSSPLDDIRPEVWTFDNELIDLLWVLDNTIDLLPKVNENFKAVIQGKVFKAEDFPKPTSEEKHSKSDLSLFEYSGVVFERED